MLNAWLCRRRPSRERRAPLCRSRTGISSRSFPRGFGRVFGPFCLCLHYTDDVISAPPALPRASVFFREISASSLSLFSTPFRAFRTSFLWYGARVRRTPKPWSCATGLRGSSATDVRQRRTVSNDKFGKIIKFGQTCGGNCSFVFLGCVRRRGENVASEKEVWTPRAALAHSSRNGKPAVRRIHAMVLPSYSNDLANILTTAAFPL